MNDMHYIDTHFHLDLWPNPEEMVEEIERRKIYTIAVTNAPSVFDATVKLCKGKKYIRPALGLHPELVHERAGELPMFFDRINQTRYIGEIGLDFSKGNLASRETQEQVFSKIIEACALSGSKILTIHSRRAEERVLDIVGQNFPGTVILHWFSGSNKQMARALERGFFFSINASMINSRRGKEIIERIPHDRILTESDGPFAKIGKSSTSPLNISYIGGTLLNSTSTAPVNLHQIAFLNFKYIINN